MLPYYDKFGYVILLTPHPPPHAIKFCQPILLIRLRQITIKDACTRNVKYA